MIKQDYALTQTRHRGHVVRDEQDCSALPSDLVYLPIAGDWNGDGIDTIGA